MDRVVNPRDTDTVIGARHGYSRSRVNTISRSELGRAYSLEFEDRIITESIKACAIAPALAAFRDAMSIPVQRKRRK